MSSPFCYKQSARRPNCANEPIRQIAMCQQLESLAVPAPIRGALGDLDTRRTEQLLPPVTAQVMFQAYASTVTVPSLATPVTSSRTIRHWSPRAFAAAYEVLRQITIPLRTGIVAPSAIGA